MDVKENSDFDMIQDKDALHIYKYLISTKRKKPITNQYLEKKFKKSPELIHAYLAILRYWKLIEREKIIDEGRKIIAWEIKLAEK
jgi:hypothetical protein